MSEWTIISAGPSIETLPDDLAEFTVGPVVVVNRGIYRYPKADVWSIAENPDHMLGRAKTVRDAEIRQERVTLLRAILAEHKPTIWAPQAAGVTEQLRQFEGLTTVKRYLFAEWDDWERKTERRELLVPYEGTRLVWRTSTILCTLARVMQEGATYIRLFGADMRGRGGFGHPERGGRAWEKRWREEMARLEDAIAEAATHGIEIDWRQDAEARFNEAEGISTVETGSLRARRKARRERNEMVAAKRARRGATA